MFSRESPFNARGAGSDRIVLWTLLTGGLFPVLDAILREQVWGTWPSLGLLMAGFALWGLVRLPLRSDSN
ncbi:MAG TPA: hypothetical protein VL137_11225 [Polyangiaceae bacterium]|nr:hypothetical protein [Polyangiaceae bacterium]